LIDWFIHLFIHSFIFGRLLIIMTIYPSPSFLPIWSHPLTWMVPPKEKSYWMPATGRYECLSIEKRFTRLFIHQQEWRYECLSIQKRVTQLLIRRQDADMSVCVPWEEGYTTFHPLTRAEKRVFVPSRRELHDFSSVDKSADMNVCPSRRESYTVFHPSTRAQIWVFFHGEESYTTFRSPKAKSTTSVFGFWFLVFFFFSGKMFAKFRPENIWFRPIQEPHSWERKITKSGLNSPHFQDKKSM
jgi:hypothetical protein